MRKAPHLHQVQGPFLNLFSPHKEELNFYLSLLNPICLTISGVS